MREFKHDKENFVTSIGLDKKKLKTCERKVEDITDDIVEQHGEATLRSHKVEALYNAAKEDDDLFVFLVSKSLRGNKEIIVAGPGALPGGLLGKILEDVSDGEGFGDFLKKLGKDDNCDCPACTERRKKAKDGKDSDNIAECKKH